MTDTEFTTSQKCMPRFYGLRFIPTANRALRNQGETPAEFPGPTAGPIPSHVNDPTSLWPPITDALFENLITSAPHCPACLWVWPKQLFSFRWHGPGPKLWIQVQAAQPDTGLCADKSRLGMLHYRIILIMVWLINIPCVLSGRQEGFSSLLSTIWKVLESCAEFCRKLSHEFSRTRKREDTL